MTALQFRNNPAFTSRMREILADGTLQLAIQLLRNEAAPPEISPELDAIVSVRLLSAATAYHRAFHDLIELSDPASAPVELMPTYQPETDL